MICEMCGKEVPFLKTVDVEGSRLQVCGSCSKFGTVAPSPKEKGDVPVVAARLEQREKRLKERDVFEGMTLELVDDYPDRIRKARQQHGWSQEELGKMLNEKKSVVAKLESGDIRPDEKLVKKLEGSLGIRLMEPVKNVQINVGGGGGKGLTLGDFLKIEKK